MKHYIFLIFTIFFITTGYSQTYDPIRIQKIETELSSIQVDIPGLSEKIDIKMQQASLASFLLAIAETHNINLDVNNELSNISIVNNFKDVPVTDVLVYLCKTYSLSIDITGTIISIYSFQKLPEMPEERVIPLSYNPASNLLSIDLENDLLSEAFKKISDQSGKGIFFTPDLSNKTLSSFIKELPFETAMEKIAFSNNLIMIKAQDGTYEFENGAQVTNSANPSGAPNGSSRPQRPRRSNFFFQVIDLESKRLEVDFANTPINDIINDIGNELQLDIFTATPLDQAGTATVKAKDISFDQLLTKIFESEEKGTEITSDNAPRNSNAGGLANTQNSKSRFTFKKEDNVYYFGTITQISLRTATVIPLYYRSIEQLEDPTSSGRTAGRTQSGSQNFRGFANQNTGFNQGTDRNNRTNTSFDGSGNSGNQSQSLLDLIPEDIKQDVFVRMDTELNSFIVSGPNANVKRFESFIKQIDKPVPMVMIEVMILEIGSNTSLDAGIEWGIGTEPTKTQGSIFPETNLSLGATAVNRILGRIDGSSFFNIGKVVPNFFAMIKASESNGNFKVRSSPRITTLNGHRAYFSNGETSYYAITNQTFIGSQNPTTSEITNYQPIDAELSLDVKPFISADGEITMDLKVIQSSFNGERIAEDAPPGINSREFTSIVRARNNDIIVLGGLEERSISNRGSGVPFLARIPIIKWLFSKRVREGSKSKLTVLIKPTIIY